MIVEIKDFDKFKEDFEKHLISVNAESKSNDMYIESVFSEYYNAPLPTLYINDVSLRLWKERTIINSNTLKYYSYKDVEIFIDAIKQQKYYMHCNKHPVTNIVDDIRSSEFQKLANLDVLSREIKKYNSNEFLTFDEKESRYLYTEEELDKRVEGRKKLVEANKYPAVKCDNESKKLIFDIKTTGLSKIYDEILKITIIDGDGKELINSLVKPYWKEHWDSSETGTGITKDMVENAPYLYEFIPKLRGIIESANLLIRYDNAIGLDLLKEAGLSFYGKTQIDVMYSFTPYYGERDDKSGKFKNQSLSNAAKHFNYKFDKNDSLNNVNAILHCYNCLNELIESEKYFEIVKNNKKANKVVNLQNRR